MIKEDIIKLYNAIQQEKSKGSVKFRYLLLKNEGVIKQEINTLNAIEKDIEKIIDPFTREREKLIKKLGTLDSNKGVYSISKAEKIKEFNEKIKPITNTYKDLIEEHDRKYKEYLEMLKEDATDNFKFAEIKIEDLPEDMKTESLQILMKLGILK
ncbi:hypothetical protein KYB31_15725 [Clostridium felsineum]|uniref:hypothetical protein n=1 Tax=Clostridium felsineum TaxID=36839 RepID=UPI00214DC870|nr:hypothetical protein [Clostridium felsineum]MCR3760427.1 hypothetical protein [Clostridium felsineum]